jgi:hypothetical protein
VLPDTIIFLAFNRDVDRHDAISTGIIDRALLVDPMFLSGVEKHEGDDNYSKAIGMMKQAEALFRLLEHSAKITEKQEVAYQKSTRGELEGTVSP